jgi:dTDP-L-rhamnose 4-epimerase
MVGVGQSSYAQALYTKTNCLGTASRVSVVALRYANVAGERQSPSNPYAGVISIFCTRLRHGNQLIVFEDGGQLRDYVYVRDVAWSKIRPAKMLPTTP